MPIRIQDPGSGIFWPWWKNLDPGSAINILDPQHFFLNIVPGCYNTWVPQYWIEHVSVIWIRIRLMACVLIQIKILLTNDNSDQVGGHDGRRLEGDGL